MTGRDAVLDAVRAALGPTPATPDVPRAYRTAGTGPAAGAPELVDRFCERVADYRATVRRADAGAVGETVAAACAARGADRLVIAPALDLDVPGVATTPDDPATDPATLDPVSVLTGCALAIAETGTIVLDGGPVSGRRALTLVPDHHICLVRTDQIVAGVPDAIAALAPAGRDGRPITLISGPSATSDIELERVEGVHGPRRLDVIVVTG